MEDIIIMMLGMSMIPKINESLDSLEKETYSKDEIMVAVLEASKGLAEDFKRKQEEKQLNNNN